MPPVTSPFGTLTVIADPRAGEGGVAGRLEEVERELADRGLVYELRVAAGAGQATVLAREALEGGGRYLAAVGDDRTVQDVVNGMFVDGRPIVADPVLAVLPADTGCDLVKSFGLPGDIRAASGHLLGPTTYPFDVMKIQATGPGGTPVVRYAHNVAEVGLHAAAWRARERLPRFLRTGRRFLGFWSGYVRSRATDLRVVADAKTHELRGWSLIVGNGQFSDGGMRVSPRSFPGDGILDALVFTGPKSDAYRLLPRMFRHGDHVPDPGITELRAKLQLSVEAPRPMPVVADGVFLGTTPAAFQLVPRSILLKL
jgi:diacylglycerol kinase family enzyme